MLQTNKQTNKQIDSTAIVFVVGTSIQVNEKGVFCPCYRGRDAPFLMAETRNQS